MEKELIMNTQYIDYYLQKNNMSKEEFAKKCDINLKFLNAVYEQKNVDAFQLLKIVKVLNIRLDTFLFLDRRNLKKSGGNRET